MAADQTYSWIIFVEQYVRTKHCSRDQTFVDIIIVTYLSALSLEWDDSKLGTFCTQGRHEETADALIMAY